MKRVLLVNGPNLGLLGKREPDIYGRTTLAEIVDHLKAYALAKGVQVDAVQSDVEGELVATLVKARGVYDGIILNPAAYTHESVALHDALRACEVPTIEVHLSNIYAREGYRHESLTAGACVGQICGMGPLGYELAFDALYRSGRL